MQSECEKIRTWITPNTDTSYAVCVRPENVSLTCLKMCQKIYIIKIAQQTYHWSDKLDDRYSEIKLYKFQKPIHFLFFFFRLLDWYFPLATLIVFRFFFDKTHLRTFATISRDRVFWKTSTDPIPFLPLNLKMKWWERSKPTDSTKARQIVPVIVDQRI